MTNRFFLTGILGAALFVGAANAQVYVRVGPPAPVREYAPPPPGPGYVWMAGYHRWEGARYVWVPGHYILPPGRYHRWIPGHWRQTRRGWVWVEGHWR